MALVPKVGTDVNGRPYTRQVREQARAGARVLGAGVPVAPAPSWAEMPLGGRKVVPGAMLPMAAVLAPDLAAMLPADYPGINPFPLVTQAFAARVAEVGVAEAMHAQVDPDTLPAWREAMEVGSGKGRASAEIDDWEVEGLAAHSVALGIDAATYRGWREVGVPGAAQMKVLATQGLDPAGYASAPHGAAAVAGGAPLEVSEAEQARVAAQREFWANLEMDEESGTITLAARDGRAGGALSVDFLDMMEMEIAWARGGGGPAGLAAQRAAFLADPPLA